MIQADELMIGDWVLMDMNYQEENPMYARPDYQPYRIEKGEDIDLACETNCTGDEGVYRPIPLTSGILEANGFEYHEGERGLYGVTVSPYYVTDGSPYIFCDGDPFAVWFEEEVPVRYVHQLQHILRLCGVDKEITVKE